VIEYLIKYLIRPTIYIKMHRSQSTPTNLHAAAGGRPAGSSARGEAHNKMKDTSSSFRSDTLRRSGSSVFARQYDLQSMQDWNKEVITTFPPSTQYFDDYNHAYGWVRKLKELAFLSDLFNEIDKDGSGLIDKEEFTLFATHPTTKRIFASRFGFQPHQKDKIFLAISGGEEEISYDKWMNYLYNLMKASSSGQAQEYSVFQRDKRKHAHDSSEENFKPFKPLPLPSRGGKQKQPSFAHASGPAWFLKMYPANPIVERN